MTVPFILFVSIILAGIGWTVVSLLDRFNSFTNGERLALSFLVGCFFNYLGVFAVGMFRLDTLSMWGLIAAMGLLAIPGLRQFPWSTFQNNVCQELKFSLHDRWLGLLWITAIGIGGSSLIQGMAPPNDYDSLMYHLTQPQYDLEMGRLSIPWDRALGTELFPALAGHLSRLALATVGPGAAQMLHGMLGIIGGLGAALLVIRLGYDKKIGLIAAIFFLSTRVVIWEMGTVETDVPLAAFLIVATLSYIVFRGKPTYGTAILTGLLIGGGILTKYHGFVVAAAFAPLILFDLARHRIRFFMAASLPIASFISLLPHMLRNYVITENPIYPLLNTFFNPDKHNFFVIGGSGIDGVGYGTGRGLEALILTPWNMFINPMQLFDGMIFGAPYLLAFTPLLLLNPQQVRKWVPALAVAFFYFLGWFYLLDFQVRFLSPIVPILSAAAAAGFVGLWHQSKPYFLTKISVICIGLVFALNQSLFVGVYSAIRLPAAVGLMTADTYHSKTPTMDGAMFRTCSFIREHLKPGDTYYSMMQPHSFYCPQAGAINTIFPDRARWWLEGKRPPEDLSIDEFIAKAETAGLKFFHLPSKYYNRRNETATMEIYDVSPTSFRYGEFFVPVMRSMKPLSQDPYTAVYSGPEFIEALKKQRDQR